MLFEDYYFQISILRLLFSYLYIHTKSLRLVLLDHMDRVIFFRLLFSNYHSQITILYSLFSNGMRLIYTRLNLVSSILMMITIIGIPFGMQTLKLAGLALWPFGKEVRSGSRSSGCLYILMNVIWIFVGGIWICLSHLVFGAILCITVIGIPFGLQHFKLASLALTPFGKDIVTV